MIIYVDNTKKSTINKTKNQTEKLPELISEFSLVIVYKIKINTKKNLAFLHSNSEHVKTEIKSILQSKENQVLRYKLKTYTVYVCQKY